MMEIEEKNIIFLKECEDDSAAPFLNMPFHSNTLILSQQINVSLVAIH